MQQTTQPDDLEIGNTPFGCHHCNGLLDRVFHGNEEWLACPSCGWVDHPDSYEPGHFYRTRYN